MIFSRTITRAEYGEIIDLCLRLRIPVRNEGTRGNTPGTAEVSQIVILGPGSREMRALGASK